MSSIKPSNRSRFFSASRCRLGVLGRAHIFVPAEVLGFAAVAREHLADHPPTGPVGLEVVGRLAHVDLRLGRLTQPARCR